MMQFYMWNIAWFSLTNIYIFTLPCALHRCHIIVSKVLIRIKTLVWNISYTGNYSCNSNDFTMVFSLIYLDIFDVLFRRLSGSGSTSQSLFCTNISLYIYTSTGSNTTVEVYSRKKIILSFSPKKNDVCK